MLPVLLGFSVGVCLGEWVMGGNRWFLAASILLFMIATDLRFARIRKEMR